MGCPYHDELCSTTCCVALVVLWMGLHQEKFPLLATTLQAAAGVAGSQRWALILPSSARFFFYCKAELAIKPCRSSRSNTRGGFEKFHDTCKTGNKNTTKQTTTPQPNSPKHQQNKQEHGKCHWMVRQVVKKSETSEAAQRSHMLNSTRKHKVSLVLCR